MSSTVSVRLKSVPFVGDGNKPGLGHVRRMPSSSAASQSEVEVVATAKTSARSASRKLHIAGTMEPIGPLRRW